MNKRIVSLSIVGALLVCAALSLSAQSLLDNEYYKKAKDLLAQSQAALDTGRYDSATQLASDAQASFAKSDEYVATMLSFYRGNGWLTMAEEGVAYAKSIQADVNYKDKYDTAVAEVASAKEALDSKDYQGCVDHSKNAIAALEGIAPVVAKAKEPAPQPQPTTTPEGPQALPEYYTVRLLLPQRDCFWRIAAYPFVYNDPWKWKLLYDANKSVIEDPNNPDLIEVGQRFVIPNADGEKREGEYDPSLDYSSLIK